MSFSYLKKGAATHSAIEQVEKQQEIRESTKSKAMRFWMKEGNQTQITFLDGNLTQEGLLDIVSWNEHQMKLNGHWQNWFNCTKQGLDSDEDCPICEDENHWSQLVAFLTVIDHTAFTDGKGNKRQHVKRLFAAKKDTVKRLQFLATKNGGLAGCTFDVARIGDKAANVGSDFDLVAKRPLQEIAQMCGLKTSGLHTDEDNVLSYNYEEILHYLKGDDLRALGFGTQVMGSSIVKEQLAGHETPGEPVGTMTPVTESAPATVTSVGPVTTMEPVSTMTPTGDKVSSEEQPVDDVPVGEYSEANLDEGSDNAEQYMDSL